MVLFLAFACPCMESMKVEGGFLYVLSMHGPVFGLSPCPCMALSLICQACVCMKGPRTIGFHVGVGSSFRGLYRVFLNKFTQLSFVCSFLFFIF